MSKRVVKREREKSRRVYTLNEGGGKGRCWNEEELEEEQRTRRLHLVTPDSVCCSGANTVLLFTAKKSKIDRREKERDTDHEMIFLSPISPVTRFFVGIIHCLASLKGRKEGRFEFTHIQYTNTKK